MAAAPNYPMPDAITLIVNIDTNYNPSRQGIVVSQGDQITFNNNSGLDIVIAFQTNGNGQPVYSPMTLAIANGGSNSFTTPNYNCAANYYIYEANTQPPVQLSGPFVIQVGSGPIFITIGGTPTSPTYNPATVAVPLGTSLPPGAGKVQIIATAASFGINWNNGNDPFTPPVTVTGGSAHSVSLSASAASYAYTAGQSVNENPAGGKVIIQN
jgi:hypothetical protein